jgi:aldehyde oxidoreductase
MIDKLRPKYQEAKKRVAANSTDAVKRGVGISLGVYGYGLDGPDTAETDVELNAYGTITVYNTWEDHGQGADMGTMDTAHEALRPLGLTTDRIKLVMNDTGKCPNSGPAGGSRSQVVVGQSIRVACEELLKVMKKDDGSFRTYDEMVAAEIPTKVNGKWSAPACNCDDMNL